jgi:deazaflavin-dependent oxidoreductase (nitroreductase family)
LSKIRDWMLQLGHTEWFGRWGPRLVHRIDLFVNRLTGGRITVSEYFAPTLLLTAIGRKSGAPRTVPLLYVEHRDGYVVAGSAYGQEGHPAWSWNLLSNPEAEVEVDGETVPVRARLVEEHERRQALWNELEVMWPAYRTYRERASHREIRLFVLEPRDDADGAVGNVEPA